MGYKRKLVTRTRKETKQRAVYEGNVFAGYESYLADVPYTTYENVWDNSGGSGGGGDISSYDSGSSSYSGDSGGSY
jgi:hypothetical protein